MNNLQDCYSYEDIVSINKKLKLNMNDEKTRIIQHRLFDFNKMMNILFVEIFENNILKSDKPFLGNLITKINDHTNISLKSSEIYNLIELLVKNKDQCKKALQIPTQSGGTYGWILPSNDKTGKNIDVFSLILDFIGLVPGYTGNIADIVNFFINIYRKRYFDAGISFLGLFSYIGLGAPFTKLGMRYFNKEEESEGEGEGAEEEGEEAE